MATMTRSDKSLTDLELWGRPRGTHPSTHRDCRVCAMQYSARPGEDFILCLNCLREPAQTLELIEEQLTRIRLDRDALCEAWVARQANLSEPLASRWTNLVAARVKAEIRVEHFKRGKRVTGRVQMANTPEEAERELTAILAKIDRTRLADRDIAQLLREEKSHIQALDHFYALRVRWEMARSDLEVSQGREYP